jgi:hypothetical protein
LEPEHVVPLALHLAEQDASGVTGQVLKASEWNEAHVAGGQASFRYAGDAARA